MFSYLRTALLKTFVSSSKKVVKLLDTGGLYILKQIHLLFEMVNSEQIHSILSDVYSGIVLQIKPFFTNSMRPPPYLSLSFLLLISYPSKVNCAVGKLSSNLVSLKTK